MRALVGPVHLVLDHRALQYVLLAALVVVMARELALPSCDATEVHDVFAVAALRDPLLVGAARGARVAAAAEILRVRSAVGFGRAGEDAWEDASEHRADGR